MELFVFIEVIPDDEPNVKLYKNREDIWVHIIKTFHFTSDKSLIIFLQNNHKRIRNYLSNYHPDILDKLQRNNFSQYTEPEYYLNNNSGITPSKLLDIVLEKQIITHEDIKKYVLSEDEYGIQYYVRIFNIS